jgi:hypothetical protein
LLLPLVYLNAVHGMTHALIRYALPVMPIVFLLAAQGLVELEARITSAGSVGPIGIRFGLSEVGR